MDLARGPLDLSNGARFPLDGSEVPLIDLASAIALLPGYAQGDGAGKMRDILLTVIRALANRVWADIGGNQNGVQSARFADEGMLAIWGLLREMPRYVGEPIGAYRTRLLTAPGGVTPNAIRGAITAAAAQFNATVAFQEPGNDGEWFTDDSLTNEAWSSFLQADAAIYWNWDPTIINQTTGGFFAPDVYGAVFWVLQQLTAGSDALTPHWRDDTLVDGDQPQDYFADNSTDWGFWGFDQQPLEEQIVAIVNAMKAFGVAWALFESPYLNAAY